MKITPLSMGFCSLYKGPRFHWKILRDILTGGDNIENHYTKWLMALWGSSHIGLVILITNYFISHPHFLPVHPRRDNENKQLKERCWCVEDLGQLQDSSCSSAGFVVKASLLDLIFSWQPVACAQLLAVSYLKVLESTDGIRKAAHLCLYIEESV